MALRANVYFDGQNFLNEARRAFKYTRADYDPIALSELICAKRGWELGSIYLYTGMPPSHWGVHNFWAAKKLSLLSRGVQVFTKPLVAKKKRVQLPDGRVQEETFYVEKGIDVRIALDITRHAAEGAYDVLVLCSLDQDFAEAVKDVHRIAEERGRNVEAYSAYPFGAQEKKIWAINGTRRLPILKEDYDKCTDQRQFARASPSAFSQPVSVEMQLPARLPARESSRPWFVITGGPCSGKTTLLNELANKGYAVVPEAARTYIETRLAEGQTIKQIRGDEAAFQLALIPMKARAEESVPAGDVAFLDRGMHDSVVYLAHVGVKSHPTLDAALPNANYSAAFLLDLLPFGKDEARTENAHEALAIHEGLGRVYEAYNIPVVRVPLMSVSDRVDFVLSQLRGFGVT